MARAYLLYLHDILSAIADIQAYITALPRTAVEADKMRLSASFWNMQNIGEAAKNIPQDVKAQMPDVDWKGAAGMRAILAHHYYEVDNDLIWQAITEDLPLLQAGIQRYLQANANVQRE